jgi:hypothetical protein
MSSTVSRPSRVSSRSSHHPSQVPKRRIGRSRTNSRRAHLAGPERHTIARYADRSGRDREIVTRTGRAGSVLVFDRDAATQSDPRLVAHLAADEPPENAAIASHDYLSQVRRERYVCRGLLPEDLTSLPFPEISQDCHVDSPRAHQRVVDREGRRYELACLDAGMSIPELRWCRIASGARVAETPVSVREAIGALQDYQPVGVLTRHALRQYEADRDVSVTVLRGEFVRVRDSPIVLNRGLREAVLRVVEREGLSMSEIAVRCGRVKRDRAGNESGETSWLARRLGLLPEGGRKTPTPWIHSDVLAIIARDGLGIGPREVELD